MSSAGAMLLLGRRRVQPLISAIYFARQRSFVASAMADCDMGGHGLWRGSESCVPHLSLGSPSGWGYMQHVRGLSSAAGREIRVRHLAGAHAGIAELQMHRASAKNALGKVFVNELFEALEALCKDSSVRVLIVRSELKGVFCSGADLKERARMSNEEVHRFVQRLRSLMNEIAALPMPTIAAIDGYALGGGLELALACDLRIAACSAKMGLIETTRGLLPGAGGSQRLPRLIGLGLAKELIFTGRQVDGHQALTMGLANHAVEQNEAGDAAYQQAVALAQEIAPQAPVAVRMAKLSMNKGIEVDIASGMSIEGMCYSQVIPTKDRIEGMAAFAEKRSPHFTGE